MILLTQNPLCRVPSHSSPLTQEPRLRYSRLGAFPSPSGAHYSESASARLPPPRVRCETVNQFYFSLKGFLLNIHEVYHSIYVLSIPFLYFFVKKSKLIAVNLPVFESPHCLRFRQSEVPTILRQVQTAAEAEAVLRPRIQAFAKLK